MAQEVALLLWLETCFAVLLSFAGIEREVRLFIKQDKPKGKNLLAWTLPADAYPEAPTGGVVISLHIDTLKQPKPKLLNILAHEIGHAKHNYEALLEGKPVDEKAAKAEARRLLTSELQDLLLR